MRGTLESGRRLGIALCGAVVAVGLSGCAVSGGGSGTSQPTGNTRATLLITADNNAQIPIVYLNLQSVTLVKTDGTSVPLMTAAQTVELGSLNGVAHPLATATVPQGTYTSVEMVYGPSKFVVIDESTGPGATDIATYNFGGTVSQQPVTVKTTLSSALTVSGGAMGLLLNLSIPNSIRYTAYSDGSSATQPNGGQTSFTPVYSMTAVPIAAQPSTLKDGMVQDVHGQVSGSSTGVLTITSDSGATLSFNTSGATVFAGTIGTTVPAAGSYVDVDAALQTDGSMLAMKVQTEGTQPYNFVGEIGGYNPQYPYITTTAREQQGPNLSAGKNFNFMPLALGTVPEFAVAWANGTAPGGLPFTPKFDASAIALGQNVATPLDSLQAMSGQYSIVYTVTLEPQTIDATVTAVASANGVTTYQVSLFPNDLMAIFGTTADVTVYATATTHTITTTPLAGGMVGRFRGLLFNDGGTMKMVATEVEDGVPGS